MVADKDKDKKKRTPSTGSAQSDSGHEHDPAEPIVHDRRKVDPETGEVRASVDGVEERLTEEDLARLLEEPEHADSPSEHLNDLKRVQAEYANYRKRVDRDRYVARELAVAEVITGMLPVLDDLDLAHAHGDLEGSPLEIVGQKIRTIFERYGLIQVGAVGELFDPKLHEAIAQLPSKDATEETIADVLQSGYRLGERLLRPAKVAVTVPEA